MTRGTAIAREVLEQLYYAQRLSMQQIADRLGCSPHKVTYWMHAYGMERRTWSEATYAHCNPDGDPFKVITPVTPQEIELFGLGLGLFMGEGTRKAQHEVTLANASPDIHRIFLAFLGQICGVARSDLRVWINIFDDRDVEVATNWWAEQLGLRREQFVAPTVRPAKGGTYKNRSLYGTLTVRFNNIKLKKIIDGWCFTYYAKYGTN